MKDTQSEVTYEHPWELVVNAYHLRYPTHERLPLLLEVRETENWFESSSVQRIKRLCRVAIEAPLWVRKVINQHDVTFEQNTKIDFRGRALIVESVNQTFRARGVELYEKCTFEVHPDNNEWTIKRSHAKMTLPKFPLAGTCEKLMVKSYDKNTAKGVEIDNEFIADLLASGGVEARTVVAPARILTRELLERDPVGHDGYPPAPADERGGDAAVAENPSASTADGGQGPGSGTPLDAEIEGAATESSRDAPRDAKRADSADVAGGGAGGKKRRRKKHVAPRGEPGPEEAAPLGGAGAPPPQQEADLAGTRAVPPARRVPPPVIVGDTAPGAVAESRNSEPAINPSSLRARGAPPAGTPAGQNPTPGTPALLQASSAAPSIAKSVPKPATPSTPPSHNSPARAACIAAAITAAIAAFLVAGAPNHTRGLASLAAPIAIAAVAALAWTAAQRTSGGNAPPLATAAGARNKDGGADRGGTSKRAASSRDVPAPQSSSTSPSSPEGNNDAGCGGGARSERGRGRVRTASAGGSSSSGGRRSRNRSRSSSISSSRSSIRGDGSDDEVDDVGVDDDTDDDSDECLSFVTSKEPAIDGGGAARAPEASAMIVMTGPADAQDTASTATPADATAAAAPVAAAAHERKPTGGGGGLGRLSAASAVSSSSGEDSAAFVDATSSPRRVAAGSGRHRRRRSSRGDDDNEWNDDENDDENDDDEDDDDDDDTDEALLSADSASAVPSLIADADLSGDADEGGEFFKVVISPNSSGDGAVDLGLAPARVRAFDKSLYYVIAGPGCLSGAVTRTFSDFVRLDALLRGSLEKDLLFKLPLIPPVRRSERKRQRKSAARAAKNPPVPLGGGAATSATSAAAAVSGVAVAKSSRGGSAGVATSEVLRHQGIRAYLAQLVAMPELAGNPVIAQFLGAAEPRRWAEIAASRQAVEVPSDAPASPGKRVAVPRVKIGGAPIERAGFVIRAVSRTEWVHEFLVVTARDLLFFRRGGSRHPTVAAALSDVVGLRRIPPQDTLWPGTQFGVIELRGGSVSFAVPERRMLDDWISVFAASASSTGADAAAASRSPATSRHVPGTEASDAMMVDGAKSGSPVVLNRSRIYFGPPEGVDSAAATALERALDIVDDGGGSIPDAFRNAPRAMIEAFLDAIGRLQACSVQNAGNSERIAAYLNVYHALLIHSVALLSGAGRARRGKKVSRKKLYRHFAYDVGGNVFTLAEIEHGLLRSPMSAPRLLHTSLLSKLLVPRFPWSDPRSLLAPTRREPRINFALSSATASSPSTIDVYRAEVLDKQLDRAAETYVGAKVSVDSAARAIRVPSLLKWYAKDFGGSRAMLTAVVAFLPLPVRHVVNEALIRGQLSVSYQPYDWTSRDRITCPSHRG